MKFKKIKLLVAVILLSNINHLIVLNIKPHQWMLKDIGNKRDHFEFMIWDKYFEDEFHILLECKKYIYT